MFYWQLGIRLCLQCVLGIQPTGDKVEFGTFSLSAYTAYRISVNSVSYVPILCLRSIHSRTLY